MHFLSFLSLEDFCDTFLSCRGCPDCGGSEGVPRILQWRGFTSWGMAKLGSGGRKSRSGVQGQSPGRGPGQSPQKLKQIVKLVYNC